MLRRSYLLEESDSENEIHRVFKQRINYNISDDSHFKECFRLNKVQIEYIVQRLYDKLKYKTERNYPLSPMQQILLSLHWLGNGSQYHALGSIHGIHKSTVCRTIHRVVDAIINELFKNIVCWPRNSTNIPTLFFQKGGFPSVCGCVDGTLIKIDAPSNREEIFVDRNGNHSLNVMMICGPNYEFYAVNANWPESVHDSRVLRNTAVFHSFENGFRPFPGAVILGDSAYPSKSWLIPPLRRNPDNETERRFNRAHKKTRRIVENSFGILKERFPCLNYLRVDPTFAAKIVLACTNLHNVALQVSNDSETFLINEEAETVDENEYSEEVEENNGNLESINSLLQFFSN